MFEELKITPLSDVPEKKENLSPMEMQLRIKSDLDHIVKEYTSKNPADLTAENYFAALHKIETLGQMAEKFNNTALFSYAEKMLDEIKAHKNLSSKSRLQNIGPLKSLPKRTARPGIGTHQ